MRSTTFTNNNNNLIDLFDFNLHTQINRQLMHYREQRKFNPSLYINAKINVLSDYFYTSGIKSCVVGVSGGVDSAVTLGIINAVLTQSSSTLKHIVPALLPKYGEGSTNQDTALARGHEVISAFGLNGIQVDLSLAHATLQASVEKSLGIKGTPWSSGQLVSNLRTPALYHLATLMTQNGQTCVVCGTTNRDEGSYLGFFGKAADGMVDVQPISDLHKSEVYTLARYLGVPQSVIAAEPTGDTFDGQTDVQMLGVPYDFIELYTCYLNSTTEAKCRMLDNFDDDARSQFETLAARVEKRHHINAHKYLAGSQSIHFDIHERCVTGGWQQHKSNTRHKIIHPSDFVGYFNIDPAVLTAFGRQNAEHINRQSIGDFNDSALLLENVFTHAEADSLFQEIKKQDCIPAGRDGYANHFNSEADTAGSYRCTTYDEKLAGIIWERIQQHIPAIRILDEYSSADWQEHKVWRAQGINPLLRFIHYHPGGSLIPHYDEGYDLQDGRRHTLMSIIIYLSDGATDQGGVTWLLNDSQRNLPIHERDFSDAFLQADDGDVLAQVAPKKGCVLIIDHRILHEATPWTGPGDRILLRTDIIFERCGIPSSPVSKPGYPLLQKLGLTAMQPKKAVDEAYLQQLSRSEVNHAELKQAWKIMRDPFYGSAFDELRSIDVLVKAGYLDDGADLDVTETRRFDSNWLMTPTHKITERLKLKNDDSQRLVVLVSTGGFSPVHKAHIEMMECARRELEMRGDNVLGGYLSPSHQSYVNVKCGTDTLSPEERIELCEKAVSTNNWLMVDNWEALQNDRPVNFTDVIEHLSSYLAKHVKSHRPVHVVYVFGSDNAGFVLAFIRRGYCVCIPRAGYEQEHAAMTSHPLVSTNKRIIIANLPEIPSPLSSQQIRSGDYSHLPENIRKSYEHIRGKISRTTKIYLRDEKDWALEPWETYCNASQLCAETKSFMSGLIDILKESFLRANQRISIDILDLNEQRNEVRRLYSNENIISLDSCIEGAVNLGVSRCFQLASPDNPGEFVARPGYQSLTQQFNSIPAGKYILLDDDIATGATINFIKKSLPATCEIESIVSLCNLQTEITPDDMIIELCDFRDFLVGARNAGLVVKLSNGRIARAPYILPYVKPSARIRLPVTQEIYFSRLIWQLNRNFFQNLATTLRVKHADNAFQTLACHIGFSRDTAMEEVCQWHMDRLIQEYLL